MQRILGNHADRMQRQHRQNTHRRHQRRWGSNTRTNDAKECTLTHPTVVRIASAIQNERNTLYRFASSVGLKKSDADAARRSFSGLVGSESQFSFQVLLQQAKREGKMNLSWEKLAHAFNSIGKYDHAYMCTEHVEPRRVQTELRDTIVATRLCGVMHSSVTSGTDNASDSSGGSSSSSSGDECDGERDKPKSMWVHFACYLGLTSRAVHHLSVENMRFEGLMKHCYTMFLEHGTSLSWSRGCMYEWERLYRDLRQAGFRMKRFTFLNARINDLKRESEAEESARGPHDMPFSPFVDDQSGAWFRPIRYLEQMAKERDVQEMETMSAELWAKEVYFRIPIDLEVLVFSAWHVKEEYSSIVQEGRHQKCTLEQVVPMLNEDSSLASKYTWGELAEIIYEISEQLTAEGDSMQLEELIKVCECAQVWEDTIYGGDDDDEDEDEDEDKQPASAHGCSFENSWKQEYSYFETRLLAPYLHSSFASIDPLFVHARGSEALHSESLFKFDPPFSMCVY